MKFRKLTYLAFAFSIPCFLQAQQAKMNIGVEAGQLHRLIQRTACHPFLPLGNECRQPVTRKRSKE